MMSIFSILLIVAIQLVPKDVTTFTIEDTDSSIIQCTLQEDGGWNAVESSGDDIGTFYVENETITMRGDGKEFSFSILDILGLAEEPDWQTMNSVNLGDIQFPIVRVGNGFDFVLSPKNEGDQPEHRIKVRWNEATPDDVKSHD